MYSKKQTKLTIKPLKMRKIDNKTTKIEEN
jgi:hypothetical protein